MPVEEDEPPSPVKETTPPSTEPCCRPHRVPVVILLETGNLQRNPSLFGTHHVIVTLVC